MKKVKIYYNQLTILEKEVIIHAGCPSVEVDFNTAEEFAEKNLDSGEWSNYTIPAISGRKTTFEEETEETTTEERIIKCTCGNEEEEQDNDTLLDSFTYSGRDEFRTYYVCNECLSDVSINNQ